MRILFLILLIGSIAKAEKLTCDQIREGRSQEARIYLVNENIISPISKYMSTTTCRKEDDNKAAEGCDFIRKDSWKFTLPFGTLTDWQKLQKKEGGRDKFYEKYGMISSPKPNYNLPMGVTLAPNGKSLHFNCFLCHGGTVNDLPFEGAANTKIKVDKLFSNFNKSYLADAYLLAVGSFGVPHHPEANRGPESTKLALDLRNNPSGNITLESISRYVLNQRKQQRNAPVIPSYAPPWWNVAPGLKSSAFISGQFSLGPSHMSVMAMLSNLTKDELKELNPSFEKVVACVQSTPVPRKEFKTDPKLVADGESIFKGRTFKNQDCNCAKCHGLTEMDLPWDYPDKQIRLDFVKTDPEFNKSFGPAYRKRLADFVKEIDPCSEFQESETEYIVAPPLIALFTKSGLLHNKSVPTLDDLLCTKQEERPRSWKIKSKPDVFDKNSVNRAPSPSPETYDTDLIGSKNTGHNFCTEELSRDPHSCQSIIEYMKKLGP